MLRVAGLADAPYLPEDGKVCVLAERIPAAEWEHLSGPVPVIDKALDIEANAITLVLPDFGPADAYLVTLRGEAD